MNTLHLTGSGELLAQIPDLLGFTPRDSVVVVSLQDGGEISMVMRVALAELSAPDVMGELSRAVAGHVARDGATRAILVTYSGSSAPETCAASECVYQALRIAVEVVDSWSVAAGRYYSSDCEESSCCPPGGRPLPQVEARGGLTRRSGADRNRGALTARAAPEDRRRASRAGDRWWKRRTGDIVGWRSDSLGLWEAARVEAAEGRAVEPLAAGKLLVALRDVVFRDAAFVSFLPAGDETARLVITGDGEEEVDRALGQALKAGVNPQSDEKSTADALRLCADLRMYARQADEAPPATLAAAVAWWDEEILLARELLAHAVRADPGYRLAHLIGATMDVRS